MFPELFLTQDEIIKKLRAIAEIHVFKNARTISCIFYDVLKMAYYAVKRKREGLRKKSAEGVCLTRKEITRITKLVDFFHVNDKTHKVDHELSQCFGANFNEADALKFFENFVEGITKDKFGRPINIDLENGTKFMYKNYETGRHELQSQYYLSFRGKRLPWIRHTIHNSKNIYTKIDKDQREIMYVSKYDLPNYDEENNKCYWVVIVKKYKKDKIAPYEFKTAFRVSKYNNMLKRLERYKPIIEVPNL